MSAQQIVQGNYNFGQFPKKAGRNFEIKAKDFSQSEQGVPLPVLFGTQRISGIYITPIFDFRITDDEEQQGKK
jgi:hypothetical protein